MTIFFNPLPASIPFSSDVNNLFPLFPLNPHQQHDVHLWGRWGKWAKDTSSQAQALNLPNPTHCPHTHWVPSEIRRTIRSLTVTPSYRPIMQKCWLIYDFHAYLGAQRKLKLTGAMHNRSACVSVYVTHIFALHHFAITGNTHLHTHYVIDSHVCLMPQPHHFQQASQHMALT